MPTTLRQPNCSEIKEALVNSAAILPQRGLSTHSALTDFLSAFGKTLPAEFTPEAFATKLGEAIDNDSFLDNLPNSGQPAPAPALRRMPLVQSILNAARPHKRHLIGLDLVKAMTALALFPPNDLQTVLRIFSERTVQVTGVDVAELRALYARLQPMTVQIYEGALAAGGYEVRNEDGPVHQTPVRPQLGQTVANGGVFCRLTKGNLIHSIAFWTPLGGLNAWNESRLPESFYASVIERYAMTPIPICYPPPFWDGTDTLYRVGIDSDGNPFGEPEQISPDQVLDSAQALAIWRTVAPEGRTS